MSRISVVPFSRRVARRVLLAVAVAVGCGTVLGEESLFDALDATPQAVGLALARAAGTGAVQTGNRRPCLHPDPFALTAFPITPEEQAELLAALATEHEFSSPPRQRAFAAMLLEGWGRPEEALIFLESEADGIDPLHFTRLRYRCGDLDGAAAAFAKARESLDEWKNAPGTLPAKTLVLTRPFEALGEPDELAGFLAWLQPQCESAHLANEILHLRLNTAYHCGTLDGLLAQLADEPPPLRDLARWSLTGDPAVLPARMEAVPVSFLPHFHRVLPGSPVMARIMETAIRKGWGRPDDQMTLLRHLVAFRECTDPLLRLWFEQDERALAVLDAGLCRMVEMAGWMTSRPPAVAGLAALADRHPEHVAANLLAGIVLAMPGARAPNALADNTASLPYLARVLDRAPFAQAADHGLGTLSLLRANRPDLPGMAVERLTELLPPEKLIARLTGRPDFARLSGPDQARYLALAKLDVPFIEALLAWDWREAAHDPCGGWPAGYLGLIGHVRWPGADCFARLRAALPAILAGSPGKSAELIAKHAEATRGLFPDDEEFKALLASLSALLEGEAKARIDDLAGALKRRTPPPPQVSPSLQPAVALGYFAPPQWVRWLDHGVAADRGQFIANQPAQFVRQQLIQDRFPALGMVRSGLGREDGEELLHRLWKLRALLPPGSPNGVAVDWLMGIPSLTATQPPADEEQMAIAAERFDAWCEHARGPDILIWRETAHMPQDEQVDWGFLAKLADAPLAIRKHAAETLGYSASRQEIEAEALRKLLLGEAAGAVPPAGPTPAPPTGEDPRPKALDAAWAALRANDPDAFVDALETLPSKDPGVLASIVFDPLCARILSQAAAPRLLDLLAARAAGQRERSAAGFPHPASGEAMRDLHRLFLDADPVQAGRFRRSVMELRLFNVEHLLATLLADLTRSRDRTAAVEFLAAVARGLGEPRAAATPLRFPASPRDPFALRPGARAAFQAAVKEGLCRELAERLAKDAGAPAPAEFVALLRYAILPTAESFREELLAIVDRQPAHLRAVCRSQLASLLEPVAPAGEHLLMHAEAATADGGFPSWVVRANRYPAAWDSATLEAVWQRLGTARAGDAPPSETVLALAPVMLERADAALWEAFRPALVAELRRGDADGLLPAILGSLITTPQRDPAMDLLRALPEVLSGRHLRNLAAAAWVLDDEDTLRAIGRRLADLPQNQELQDLAAELEARGKPSDRAVPVFAIVRQQDGGLFLCWSMTSDEEQRQVPALAVPGMDGVFDFSIELTIRGERQPEPIKLASVAARGSHALPPMPGGMGNDLVVVKVTRREDGETVHSATVLPPHEHSVAVTTGLPEGFAAPRPMVAPFDLMPPPTGLLLAGEESVKLAAIPWEPGQGLTLGLWFMAAGAAQFELRIFDTDDHLVGTRILYRPASRNLPGWHHLEARFAPVELAAGHRLALYATRARGRDLGAAALWLTALRATILDESKGLPSSAAPIGRLPSSPTAMTCTPDGAFLAFGMATGRVVIMDAATGAIGEFAPRRTLAIAALAMGGGRVVAMSPQGTLQIMNLSTGAVHSPGALLADGEPAFNTRIALSPDGEWLIWCDPGRALRIIKLEDDRLGRAVALPVKDQPCFAMDHWGGMVIASGSAGHFVIPFTSFATLEPGALVPLADFPEPRCAYLAPADLGRNDPVRWEIPRAGVSIMQEGGGFRVGRGDRANRIPAAGGAVTVAADGTVFFAAPGGMVHRLDPADLADR